MRTDCDVDRSHAERVRRRPGAGGKDEFDPERPRVRLTGRFKEANHPAATAMAGWALAPCVLSCIITLTARHVQIASSFYTLHQTIFRNPSCWQLAKFDVTTSTFRNCTTSVTCTSYDTELLFFPPTSNTKSSTFLYFYLFPVHSVTFK